MNNIEIHDSNQLIRFSCEELRAIRSVLLTVEDHPEYGNEHEMLVIVRKILEPIIGDMQKATSTIEEALRVVQQE